MSVALALHVTPLSSPLDGLLRLHNSPFNQLHITALSGRTMHLDDHEVVDFATSAYLGLDVDVQSQDVQQARDFGLRNGWSRATGSTALSAGLEQDLAAALQMDQVRLASSAALINYSAFYAFQRVFPIAIYDQDAHITLKQGLNAAYTSETRHAFRNNDLTGLQRLLARLPSETPKLIAVDGIYSMKGTAAPVFQLVELCKRYNATLFIDDVHGFGVHGPQGLGSIEAIKAEDREHIVLLGSFAKSCSNPVAFIAYAQRNWLAVEAIEGLNYSGPPSNLHIAICRRHLANFPSFDVRRRRLQALSERLHAFCMQRGYGTLSKPGSPILAVRVLDEGMETAVQALYEAGIIAKVAIYPVVQRGDEVLRFTLTAAHTHAHCLRLEDALDGVAPLLGGMA